MEAVDTVDFYSKLEETIHEEMEFSIGSPKFDLAKVNEAEYFNYEYRSS